MTYTVEDIRKEHADVAAKAQAAHREFEETRKQIGELEQQIAAAGARYEEACLALADGKTADPGAVLAQQVALKHNLRGLEQLRDRQAAETKPFGERMQELDRLVAKQLLIEEEEALMAAHQNKFRARNEAAAKHDAAEKEFQRSLMNVKLFRARKENLGSVLTWHRLRNG
jgi:chromosome segregation ATPase